MGEYTPNYGLYKPDIGETGWGDKVNQNFDIIDTELSKREPVKYPVEAEVIEDTTVHSANSTDYETVFEVVDKKYDGLVALWAMQVYFRTTGSATAYVKLEIKRHRADYVETYHTERSTSSTTPVSVYASTYYYVQMLYGHENDWTFRVSAKTSNSSVPAEVTQTKIHIKGVKGVKP